MAEPPRSRRDERKQATRRELVASATSVFARRGFHAATLLEIATAAGFTTGAIYFHFGGKDDLFLAAFEEYAVSRVEEINQVHSSSVGDIGQVARAFADQWMSRQAEDPGFTIVSVEFFVHALRTPRLRDALAARQAAVRLAVGRMLEQETRRAGLDLTMPAQDIATVMREMCIGMALAKLLDPDAFSDRLPGDFVQTFYELATRAQAATARPEIAERDDS